MAARKQTIQPGGTRGTVFKQVAHARLEDAGVLLRAGRYGGAIYLAGYAVECLLKWAITRRLECVYLSEEYEIHALDILLVRAGLRQALRKETRLSDFFGHLADNWGPALRYLAKAPERASAEELYRQICKVYCWISENAI